MFEHSAGEDPAGFLAAVTEALARIDEALDECPASCVR